VIKEETFRIVLTLAKLKKWRKYVVDVETAFLNKNLEETIFMTEPVGYRVIIEALKKDGIISDDVDEKISDENILKLLKTMYGLVQAARE